MNRGIAKSKGRSRDDSRRDSAGLWRGCNGARIPQESPAIRAGARPVYEVRNLGNRSKSERKNVSD